MTDYTPHFIILTQPNKLKTRVNVSHITTYQAVRGDETSCRVDMVNGSEFYFLETSEEVDTLIHNRRFADYGRA
jgi:uncharacterized protein YtpQ (UPF0354 family)